MIRITFPANDTDSVSDDKFELEILRDGGSRKGRAPDMAIGPLESDSFSVCLPGT